MNSSPNSSEAPSSPLASSEPSNIASADDTSLSAQEPFPLQVLLHEAQAEAAKYKDLYVRAMAETENVRTRARRDMEDSSKYAATKFARDMVNIVENIQRACQSIPEQAREQHETIRQVADGLSVTLQELLAIFERNGIRRLDPKGEKFDHNFHQAVAQIPDVDAEPGTVAQVLQAGYMLHDRLLRPAMVTVVAQASNAVDASA